MSSHWSVRSGALARSSLVILCDGLRPTTPFDRALGGLDDEVAAGEELRVHSADLVDEANPCSST